MKPEKNHTKPGRPKHVTKFEDGKKSQINFLTAMRSILTPKDSEKKKAAG